jgi:hypothetical protein
MTTATDWCNTFNGFADAHALRTYLTNGNAQRVMDIDTLDAVIDGANACRHVADMQTTIHIWEDELTAQLLQHEYGVRARVSTCKAR